MYQRSLIPERRGQSKKTPKCKSSEPGSSMSQNLTKCEVGAKDLPSPT
jgi:hypothetical protein